MRMVDVDDDVRSIGSSQRRTPNLIVDSYVCEIKLGGSYVTFVKSTLCVSGVLLVRLRRRRERDMGLYGLIVLGSSDAVGSARLTCDVARGEKWGCY